MAHGCGGKQAEALRRDLAAWVDLGAAAAHRQAVGGDRLVGWANARVHQHERAKALREQVRGLGGHDASETVGDHDHVIAEPGVVADRDDLRRVGLVVVGIAVVGVPHSREVHGCDSVFVGELRRDEVPPVGMGVHAVDEQHRPVRTLTPCPVEDVALLDFDGVLAGLGLHRGPEPIGNRRLAAPVPSGHYPSPKPKDSTGHVTALHGPDATAGLGETEICVERPLVAQWAVPWSAVVPSDHLRSYSWTDCRLGKAHRATPLRKARGRFRAAAQTTPSRFTADICGTPATAKRSRISPARFHRERA